jgi:hypothetical protein
VSILHSGSAGAVSMCHTMQASSPELSLGVMGMNGAGRCQREHHPLAAKPPVNIAIAMENG